MATAMAAGTLPAPAPAAVPVTGSGLLDAEVTWAEFGKQHLDRRVAKAITDTLHLERPTLVQSRGIPVQLEGKDLLCRARTGSGKTLCYAVPMVQRFLQGDRGVPLRGLVLVPTKELIAQVHGVFTSLLSFCFDTLSAEPLYSGEKYLKAELPSILVTTPSSVLALAKERRAGAGGSAMKPIAETLQVLVVDEADLMFSFGYEQDMRALCVVLPAKYQAILVSATLSEEVKVLKGLMLHKPVVLKLEEPAVTGKLSQFYMMLHKTDKYLILYTLLKLQLVSGKSLIFVSSVEAAYKIKIFLERFSINSAVLNAELPHSSRQNIIQAFNQGVVDILIATDAGFAGSLADEDAKAQDSEEAEQNTDEIFFPYADLELPDVIFWRGKSEEDDEEGEEDVEDKQPPKKKSKTTKVAKEDGLEDDNEAPRVEVSYTMALKKEKTPGGKEVVRLGKRKGEVDQQFSLTRGVDLKDVSTVINVDMPKTVRDYVHRVGRCARGGASGTALTFCIEDSEDQEALLEKIISTQASSGAGEVKPLPMQIADAERFRYRVEDMARGLTRMVVGKYRARELQFEALNSEKLKAYFEENPEEKRELQRSQRQLRERKSVRKNLRTIPHYLVPDSFSESLTPVQQAVREDALKSGLPTSSRLKRKQLLNSRRRDPLQAFTSEGFGGKKSKTQFLRERMEAKDRRIDPATANVEDLPPLSGKKLWKMSHRKPLYSKKNPAGMRKRLSQGEKNRQKKFGF